MIVSRDTLVVGAGLVGMLLARSLARRGEKVCLAYDPAVKSASSVAAWMINPITGIRFVVSWRLEVFLPAAMALFRELEAESGLVIWRPQLIHRLFQGDDEVGRWEKKRLRPEILENLDSEFPTVPGLGGVDHERGGIVIRNGGWADLKPWMEISLQDEGRGFEVLRGRVERAELLATDLVFEERRFRRVIFCTGFGPEKLPWKPAKGELLTVRIPGLQLREIVLRGIFVIPLGEDFYRVGATYEWEDLSSETTQAGVKWIYTRLAALLTLPFEVVEAQAAVRPILRDARPVIGLEAGDPRFGVCNGFGSKAGLMAPWVTEHLADHLVHGTALDPEMSLARFEDPRI